MIPVLPYEVKKGTQKWREGLMEGGYNLLYSTYVINGEKIIYCQGNLLTCAVLHKNNKLIQIIRENSFVDAYGYTTELLEGLRCKKYQECQKNLMEINKEWVYESTVRIFVKDQRTVNKLNIQLPGAIHMALITKNTGYLNQCKAELKQMNPAELIECIKYV